MSIKDWIKKLWTPANRAKALDALSKEAAKLAEKEKTSGKAGLADPVTIAVVALVCGLLGGVFSSGVNTRSIVHRSQITVKDSPNATVFVDFGSNTVEVSGSGGVSIPVSGGGK